MLIKTQVERSKPKLLSEMIRVLIAKAVVYRNVDKKAWEAIARAHDDAKVVIAVF